MLRSLRTVIVGQVVVLLAFCAFMVAAATGHASTGSPRAVTLSDASFPPTDLVYVYPGQRRTLASDRGFTCDARGKGGYYSDTSAYMWSGGAMSAQRWSRDHTVAYWRPRGRSGRVTWDGVNVTNRTSQPILFAGWCDD